MDDLISRKALISELSNLDPPGFCSSVAGMVAIKKIKEAPSVDAVEVVRCRNCRHRHTRGRCAGRPRDFFCADGER